MIIQKSYLIDLPFLPERKKVNKVQKLICSIEDKEKYVMHIRFLKKAWNHGLALRKVQSNSILSRRLVKTIHWHE